MDPGSSPGRHRVRVAFAKTGSGSIIAKQMDTTKRQQNPGLNVHAVLAKGYFVYLVAIVVAFGADYIYPIHFSFPLFVPFGFFLIIAGTLVVYWAQRASGKSSHYRNVPAEKVCRDHFCVGPYVFTRSPTQYGLFIMALGLAVMYGSVYMIITTVIAILIGKFIIIPIEEKHLTQKYGEPYLEYKKQVKF